MWKTIRRIVCCAALLAALAVIAPAAARADPDMTDYNTYWQVAQDPSAPTLAWTTTPIGRRCRRRRSRDHEQSEPCNGAGPSVQGPPADRIRAVLE